MIKQALEKLALKENLDPGLMGAVMEEIMSGRVETGQIVSFLTAMNQKGETAQELTAAAAVMRLHVTRINTCKEVVLDTCGTGGDAKGTFNISTAASFVASGCGIAVAKHGNRSVSSACGSADILEKLGVNLDMPPERLEECLEGIGIAFLFAPSLHPAMKYASPARRQIGTRTMFNILGPLTNPAQAMHQLIGVYEERWAQILALTLRCLGTTHALIVHGSDGLDEITTCGPTLVAEIFRDEIKTYRIAPEDFALEKVTLDDLKGGSPEDNGAILLDILKGKPGPKRDIVVLNAAAAIYAADKAGSIKEGIVLAEHSIDSKKALGKLELLKEFSQKI